MIAAYHQPQSLDEALSLVAGGAVPVAGATSLYSGKSKKNQELVDVTRLGLGEIHVEEKQIVLGAAVTLTQITDAQDLPGMEGAVLRRGARAAASRLLRNVVTVGGNVVHAAYWGDMPVVLLALDATLEICRAGAKPEQRNLADCYQAGRKAFDGAVVTRIFVPRRDGVWGFGYERFSRTVTDYSLATACVTLRRDGKVARDVRLLLGAVAARPYRVSKVEELVEGKTINSALLNEAAEMLLGAITIAPNFRAPADYRRKLAATLARRALETAFSWSLRDQEGVQA